MVILIDMEQKQINKDTAKAEVKLYDNAHLVLFCGKCGHKQVLEENVTKEKGIQINLPPTSNAELTLVCSECKNSMGLFYVESTKKNESNKTDTSETVKEGDSNEPVQEESTTEVESV